MCGGVRLSQSHTQLLSDIKVTSVEGRIILHSDDEAKGVLLRRHSRSVPTVHGGETPVFVGRRFHHGHGLAVY